MNKLDLATRDVIHTIFADAISNETFALLVQKGVISTDEAGYILGRAKGTVISQRDAMLKDERFRGKEEEIGQIFDKEIEMLSGSLIDTVKDTLSRPLTGWQAVREIPRMFWLAAKLLLERRSVVKGKVG